MTQLHCLKQRRGAILRTVYFFVARLCDFYLPTCSYYCTRTEVAGVPRR